MITFDKKQGMAIDVGEYWGPDAENPERIIVDMNLSDDTEAVEFSYQVDGERIIIGIPVDRLKRLLR